LVISLDSIQMFPYTKSYEPFHWLEAQRQMATDLWSTTKDLVLPDLD